MTKITPADVRAELARRDWQQKDLARRLRVSEARLSRLLHENEGDQKLLEDAFTLLTSEVGT
jgi:DNA-binding Xre family transcriptional regulator